MSLSSHVLDAAAGRPAEGMHLILYRRASSESFTVVQFGLTDADGRVSGWETAVGEHRLVFATGPWWKKLGIDSFYPEVAVTFAINDAAEHYHVPLLLSPFAYSTYRGS